MPRPVRPILSYPLILDPDAYLEYYTGPGWQRHVLRRRQAVVELQTAMFLQIANCNEQ